MSKEPKPIAVNLIDKPSKYNPIRYAPGEHNAYAACVSRFATNQAVVTRATLLRWFALLRFLPEFVDGFQIVEKVGSTLDWIARFPTNRAHQFIRARWGSIEDFKRARIKQLNRLGLSFDESKFMAQAKKIFRREYPVFPKEDRPVS